MSHPGIVINSSANLHSRKKYAGPVVPAQAMATMKQKESLPVIIPAGSCNIGKTNWNYSALIV
jgi:hypothetical protein